MYKTCDGFALRRNLAKDADIIEHLSSERNVAGYLKDLVRKDMHNHL